MHAQYSRGILSASMPEYSRRLPLSEYAEYPFGGRTSSFQKATRTRPNDPATQCCAVQRSAVQRSAVQCCAVQRSAAQLYCSRRTAMPCTVLHSATVQSMRRTAAVLEYSPQGTATGAERRCGPLRPFSRRRLQAAPNPTVERQRMVGY
jgi:hypothetical protein